MTHTPGSDTESSFARWLESQHRGALGRRTAERNAAFFLPLLQPGMDLIDIGCGPGSITAGLAAAVAPGQAVGLDPDERGLADASRRHPGIRWATGFGESLPFGDSTFEAVFIHFVLQHVAEPAAIAREAFRVLRPGGVIGVADADYAGSIAGPFNDAVERSHRLVIELRMARGGSPLVGRELGVLLHQAGFADVSPGARAEVVSGVAVAQVAAGQAAYFAAPELRAVVIERNLATAGELDAIPAGWAAWGATPGATWARFTCFATARKP